MKCIFAIDGINYLSQTKREAMAFIKFWYNECLTLQYPRPFKTTWRFNHVERAPSYGQIARLDLSKVEYGKQELKT